MTMDKTADHARRLESVIRQGTIAEIDYQNARVRVLSGELTTDWLPWHTGGAGGVKQWQPPSLGEQVIVLSPSGETGAGTVLGGLYSTANGSPSLSGDEIKTVYPDGSSTTYNHATGALVATGIKSVAVTSADTVTFNCPSVTLNSEAVHVTGTLTADVDVIANGVSLKNHVHKDTQTGNGLSGVPQ